MNFLKIWWAGIRKAGALALAPLSVLWVSCNEEGMLGLDLLPDRDRYDAVTDSFVLVGGTVPEDSLQSQLPGALLLGEVNDPIFGRARASCAFQIMPASENLRLAEPDSLIALDSLVFSISLAGYQGDTNSSMRVRVHEISPTVEPARIYYSRQPVRTLHLLQEAGYRYHRGQILSVNEPLGTNRDSVLQYSGVFRMRLDTCLNGGQDCAGSLLANRLLQGKDSIEYKNTASFLQFFKGLQVELLLNTDALQPGKGLLLQSNPFATKTGLYLYYRSGSERRRLDLMLRPLSGSRNVFSFDFDKSLLGRDLYRNSKTDSTLEHTFVMAGSGVKTKFFADSLYHLLRNSQNRLGSGWVVHKAVLELEGADTADARELPFPSQLFLVPVDSQGRNMASLMPDLYESYYDGYLRDGIYRFGITRYIQNLLRSSTSGQDLVLIPGNPVASLARVRLRTRPRLRVTYTRIP